LEGVGTIQTRNLDGARSWHSSSLESETCDKRLVSLPSHVTAPHRGLCALHDATVGAVVAVAVVAAASFAAGAPPLGSDRSISALPCMSISALPCTPR